MAGAQFTLPLITVIPGQLIASSLWNNEFTNIANNLNPLGLDGYEDTDTQMQIQTAPYPGSVTSHASSTAGELERLRYQLSQILGTTYWYQPPAVSIATAQNSLVPIGGSILYPSATPPNSSWLLKNGQAIGRSAYAGLFALIGTTFGVGDGSTTFNIPNATDRMPIAAGNLYALGATGGAVSNTPAITITDPTHNHTQNSHTHTTPSVASTMTGGGNSGQTLNADNVGIDPGTGNLGTLSGSGSIQYATKNGTTASGTTGSTTPTNNAASTGITAASATVPTLPPYLAEYWMIRVL